MKEVLVLGGGISGLATAWNLHKAGIPFKLIEKQVSMGGVISSKIIDDTIIDFGPNSLRDRDGSIRKLAKEVGLKDEIIDISEAFKTRFIIRNRELQALKPSLSTLLTTDVISGKGKLRALAEPFIPKGIAEDESVGSFLERRIGKEAVEYLVDPVFSGIYAGDIYKISKKEILPTLAEKEQKFGSIVMGVLRSKKEKSDIKPMVLTFKKGIQQLTEAIVGKISDRVLNEEVISIRALEQGFEVETSNGIIQAERVISCLPAHSLSVVLDGFDTALSNTLESIDYVPMLSTQVIFNKKDVELPQSGFGFLIPRNENIRLLGAIWKSSIFPELSSDDKLHFTLMTGGAHDRDIINENIQQVEEEVLAEFSELMNITPKPAWMESKLWHQAIPQFHVGYQSVRKVLKRMQAENPGFYIGGNYRWGVSVPDCVGGAEVLVHSIKKEIAYF
ncbi:protoporphyrinogen oxidase [Gracilimonas sp.]|uniref:protoporphyrinogen oxidase n=1 Tax=Gracilimonas sp. TaxID=1974203 RepID=UPI0028715DF9|nr:protoporphyrinogen oxidase [Gracilimonas sp.]